MTRVTLQYLEKVLKPRRKISATHLHEVSDQNQGGWFNASSSFRRDFLTE